MTKVTTKAIRFTYNNMMMLVEESSDALSGHSVYDNVGNVVAHVSCEFSAQRVAEALAQIEQEEDFSEYMKETIDSM